MGDVKTKWKPLSRIAAGEWIRLTAGVRKSLETDAYRGIKVLAWKEGDGVPVVLCFSYGKEGGRRRWRLVGKPEVYWPRIEAKFSHVALVRKPGRGGYA